MKNIREYFNLNRPYEFDINDITALIYAVCATLGIMGMNVTPLFFLGSAIGVATCAAAKKINLVILNVALFALNAVNFIKLIF